MTENNKLDAGAAAGICPHCKRPQGLRDALFTLNVSGKCFRQYAYRDRDALADCEEAAKSASPTTPAAVMCELPTDHEFGVWNREGKWWVYAAGIKGDDYGMTVGEWGELGMPVKRRDLPRGGWSRAQPSAEVASLQEALAEARREVESAHKRIANIIEVAGHLQPSDIRNAACWIVSPPNLEQPRPEEWEVDARIAQRNNEVDRVEKIINLCLEKHFGELKSAHAEERAKREEAEKALASEKSDHSNFLAFMAGSLAEYHCDCTDDECGPDKTRHASTPPMCWPELIACIIKKAVKDAKAESQSRITTLEQQLSDLKRDVNEAADRGERFRCG